MTSVTAQPAARRARLVWLAGAIIMVTTAVIALGLTAMLGQRDPADAPRQQAAVVDEMDSSYDPDDPDETVVEELADEAEPGLLVPIESRQVALDRDPFRPVIAEPDPAPADSLDPTDPLTPSDPLTPPDPAQLPDGQSPSDPSDQADSGDPSDPSVDAACFGDVEVVCDGRVLTLEETVSDGEASTAVVVVDGATHVVGPGDAFAAEFTLLSIDGGCATIEYSGHTHLLCASGAALK